MTLAKTSEDCCLHNRRRNSGALWVISSWTFRSARHSKLAVAVARSQWMVTWIQAAETDFA